MRHHAAAVLIVLTGSAGPVEAGQTTQADPSTGRTVRVTAVDGTRRTGELVSLTTTDVVIRQDGQAVTIPLATVAAVERKGRAKLWGALIGGAVGAVYGYGVFEEDTSDPNFEKKGALIIGGLGAAGGFGLGALIDRAHRRGNTLYRRTAGTLARSVMPMATRSARGLSVTVRW